MIGPILLVKHWKIYDINLISLSHTYNWLGRVQIVTESHNIEYFLHVHKSKLDGIAFI